MALDVSRKENWGKNDDFRTYTSQGRRILEYLAQEPGDKIAEEDGFVGLGVVLGCRNSSYIPEVAFPFVDAVPNAARVKEQHPRGALYEPATIDVFDTAFFHRSKRRGELGRVGFGGLDFHGSGPVGEWADEAYTVTIFLHSDGSLRLNNGVDASNCNGRAVSKPDLG
jgi:hypothetical protein